MEKAVITRKEAKARPENVVNDTLRKMDSIVERDNYSDPSHALCCVATGM